MLGLFKRRREQTGRSAAANRILLVGGEEELHDTIRRFLGDDNHEILNAPTGRLGLAMAAKRQPQAIILDNRLSDSNALEFCRLIREHKRTQSIPILFLSAESTFASLDDAFEAGADTVLPRPFRSTQLCHKVQRLIREGSSVHPGEREDIPAALAEAFVRIEERSRPLRDVAEVFSGITTGNNRKYLADLQRSPSWDPIIMPGEVQQHGLLEGDMHIFFYPRMLLRCPPKRLFARKKVVVRRNAPPFTAAVDREGRLTEGGLYNIVPADGLECEYIAALLNSRVMDFYLRRIHPLPEHDHMPSLLRPIDLESLPVLVPKRSIQGAIVALVRELETLSPRRDRSRRVQLRAAVNQGIFEVYGFGRREIERLNALNF